MLNELGIARYYLDSITALAPVFGIAVRFSGRLNGLNELPHMVRNGNGLADLNHMVAVGCAVPLAVLDSFARCSAGLGFLVIAGAGGLGNHYPLAGGLVTERLGSAALNHFGCSAILTGMHCVAFLGAGRLCNNAAVPSVSGGINRN